MPANLTPEELTLKQQVAILMAELPEPIQSFLRSPERDAVSAELSAKYRLHTDQAGDFSRAYIYMLLGIFTPDEFVQELRTSQIPEESIRGLTADVNERVFKPLQNAERITNSPISTPSPVSVYRAQIPTPAPTPPAAPQYSVPQVPAPPIARTMAQDVEAIKQAPAPYISRPSYQTASPARSFQTSSVASTTPVPQHLPGSLPPTPVPTIPVWQPPIQPVPTPSYSPGTPRSKDSTPIVKEYGVDPYRETPE